MGTYSEATAVAAGMAGVRPAFSSSLAPVNAERRGSRRYSIDLTACYELRDAREPWATGSARVINISSGGILLDSEHPLKKDLSIRLRIAWPALLNDMVPLALHVEGKTVRAEGNRAAVRILKSEFRTRPIAQAATATRPGPASVR